MSFVATTEAVSARDSIATEDMTAWTTPMKRETVVSICEGKLPFGRLNLIIFQTGNFTHRYFFQLFLAAVQVSSPARMENALNHLHGVIESTTAVMAQMSKDVPHLLVS